MIDQALALFGVGLPTPFINNNKNMSVSVRLPVFNTEQDSTCKRRPTPLRIPSISAHYATERIAPGKIRVRLHQVNRDWTVTIKFNTGTDGEPVWNENQLEVGTEAYRCVNDYGRELWRLARLGSFGRLPDELRWMEDRSPDEL